MAVREFTDSKGRHWRVWEVTPEAINPRTKEEDYLAALYYTGWIVFETREEDDKRRLYPVPKGWNELPEAELEVLLQKAERVPQRKLRSDKEASGEDAAAAMQRAHQFAETAADDPESAQDLAREETPDVTDLGVQRSFRYPGGRIWAVSVMQTADDVPPVLRFAAGTRTIDLKDWPKDWADMPDDGLVDLLRRAAPRGPARALSVGIPRRRYNDPRP